MAFRIEVSEAASSDLELIFDFLTTAGLDFGEAIEAAFEHATSRVVEIVEAMERIGDAPYQGTLRPELGIGIRNVTKYRAIFYFEVVEERLFPVSTHGTDSGLSFKECFGLVV